MTTLGGSCPAAVELAVSGRYGYVRDELYFLASGRHLGWGYVDQPALTPLLARLDAMLTGNTLVGLRALPALGLAALVLLTAAMARAMGAGRHGQLLAAIATACCAEYLGAMHELTTTPVDFVGWAAALLAVIKLLTSSDPRWWLALGGYAGVGMDAKWNIGFLVAALAAGFALTPAARPLLRSRYLAGAAVLALGGKGYYPGGIYTFCFAAGATALGDAPLRPRAIRYVVAAAVSAVIALPLLPAAALARFPVQKVNYDLGEEIGWPSEVALIARTYDALPASERTEATVIAGNYGEAGAVDRYGAALGLPQVYSGANDYWLWGPPPPRDTAAVAINVAPALLHRWFSSVGWWPCTGTAWACPTTRRGR